MSLEIGIINLLSVENAVDIDGELELWIRRKDEDDVFVWINKSHAAELIEHLKKVFEL